MGATIEKVSIIVSKGSLEGVYPGLIMANGARAEGMEANLFFTFFGLDAIHKKRLEHIKVAAVGNPGMHMASLIGVLPGMSAIATHMMEKKMEEHDIPGIPEIHGDDRGHRVRALRVPGVGRPLWFRQGRLHRPGAGRHHGGRVLREGGGWRDHLHVTEQGGRHE